MIRVLVIEDDAHNAILFRKILEKRLDCCVSITESPEEMLSLVRGGDVGLVIMDVSLTNSIWEGNPVSGVDLCHLLRSQPDTASVPILLATAHAMRGDAERLLAESGADDYVAKPILDLEAFVGVVRRLIREAA
jgi:two-component system cell cycle response regulator DivK